MTERDGLTRSTPRLAPPLSQEKNAAWKKNRNNHARLLLHQLGVGRLEAPFDKMPYDGRLAMLPPHALYCLAFGGGGGGGGLSGGSGRWNARRASKECSNDRRRGPFLESVGKTSYRSLLDDFGAPPVRHRRLPSRFWFFRPVPSRRRAGRRAPRASSLAARVHPPSGPIGGGPNSPTTRASLEDLLRRAEASCAMTAMTTSADPAAAAYSAALEDIAVPLSERTKRATDAAKRAKADADADASASGGGFSRSKSKTIVTPTKRERGRGSTTGGAGGGGGGVVVVGDSEHVNELGAIRERCRELEYRCDARAFSFLSSRANDDDQSRSSTSSSTLTDRGPPRVVRLGRAEEIATASRRESELAKEALLKTQKAKGDELKALRIAHKKEIDQLIETFERRRSGDVGDMLRGDAAGTGTGTGGTPRRAAARSLPAYSPIPKDPRKSAEEFESYLKKFQEQTAELKLHAKFATAGR